MTTLRSTRLLLTGFLGLLISEPAAAQPNYTITDLGPQGGCCAWAQAINFFGNTVGGLWTPATNWNAHAFSYSNGRMTDLGTLGGSQSWGTGINLLGQVAGYSDLPGDGSSHAFLYTRGTMKDLGTLGGTTSMALGVNIVGQVVGGSTIDGAPITHPFLYWNERMMDLGIPPNSLGGQAWGINDFGQVAVNVSIDGGTHAFLYSNGNWTDLGTLGGSESWPYGINNLGEVVGESDTEGNAARHAFLYSRGKMKDLGTVSGSGNSRAVAVNDSGEVVGCSYQANGVMTGAFVYYQGSMYDLTSRLMPGSAWSLSIASGIDDAGQIAGEGVIGNQTHAFRLDPTGPRAMVTAKQQAGRKQG